MTAKSCCAGLFAFCIFAGLSINGFGQDGNAAGYWKGNLHTHSFWSDGTDFPEMIAKWYVDHDYDFLALSDHNILSRGEKWMDLSVVEKRGGKTCLEKYRAQFGDAVEIREVESKSTDPEAKDSEPATATEVRLKTYDETRKLFEKPGDFILIECEEISDSFNRLPIHMNATNLRDLLRPVGGNSVRETIRNNMRAANEQASQHNREILVHLNHPNFGWAITPEDLAAVTEEQFFEIFNGHPGVRQLGDDKHPSLEKFWDVVNTLRISKLESPPAYGLGVDDSHEYHGRQGSQPGRAWVMVKADELSPDALIKSMKQGDFYSSSGVTLNRIHFDQELDALTVEIEGEPGVEYTTHFIGTRKEYQLWEPLSTDDEQQESNRTYSADIGATLKSETGLEATYQFSGDELYVRALIVSNKPHPNPSIENQFEQAWTQPFGWR